MESPERKRVLHYAERVRYLARDLFFKQLEDKNLAVAPLPAIVERCYQAAEAFYDHDAQRFPDCQE